jgi:hypothetical protein
MPVRYAHVTPEQVTTKRLLNPHHSINRYSRIFVIVNIIIFYPTESALHANITNPEIKTREPEFSCYPLSLACELC